MAEPTRNKASISVQCFDFPTTLNLRLKHKNNSLTVWRGGNLSESLRLTLDVNLILLVQYLTRSQGHFAMKKLKI
jgi:hypothetical protein